MVDYISKVTNEEERGSVIKYFYSNKMILGHESVWTPRVCDAVCIGVALSAILFLAVFL